MSKSAVVREKKSLASWLKGNWMSVLVLTVMMALLYPLTFWLPLKWAWKANVLEWIHALLLTAGFAMAFWFGLSSRHSTVARFWYWTMPVWFLMLWRDLNWGRIFYPPVAMSPEGPVFGSLRDLWYGRYVYPAIALILLVWVWMFVRYRLYKVWGWIVRLKAFPIFETVVSSAMIFVMLRAEDGVLLPGSSRGEMLEELAEFVLFLSFILFNLALARSLQKYEDPLAKTNRQPSRSAHSK